MYICIYIERESAAWEMTWNAMWSNRRLRYKAPSTCKILPLSLPKQYVVIFLKGLFCICKQKLWRRKGSVKIRYMDGSFLAETSVTSPGVPCHINIYYKHMYIYMLCTFIHKYIYYIYDDIFTSRYTCYVYIWISYIFISTNIIQT